MNDLGARVAALVRDVPGFPHHGVVFKDVAPLLADPLAFQAVVDELAQRVRHHRATLVAGIEARGFVLAAPAALAAGVGFLPLRKAGKLPGETRSVAYSLEYAEATLEVQRDAIPDGARVLIVDDVLATGGTARAATELVRLAAAQPVEVAVLLELAFLAGRERLHPVPVSAVLTV